ncbi:MAG: cation/H(+) antiporter, partial [Flammeovirgaceae bacterium]|nr:cation/H(+) antiporter [Flammeovirgaceae bacterium]MDW8289044.1 cation/H(+) antiporter [Flammeovirgaceae bacterium]
MMVIMALATTFMTGPSLNLIQYFFKTKTQSNDTLVEETAEKTRFKVLVSFGHPERGRTLLRLAHSLTHKFNGETTITAMHLSPANELNQYNAEQYEKESFAPVIDESLKLNQKIVTLFKPSSDIETDITDVANQGNYDLLLIGVGQSIFEGSLLGKILGFTTSVVNPENLIHRVTKGTSSPFDQRTRTILAKSKVPVGVLVDRGLQHTEKILLVLGDVSDVWLMNFVQKFVASGSTSCVTILLLSEELKKSSEWNEKVQLIASITINYVSKDKINKDFLASQNLMLISIPTWKKLLENKTSWLPDIPSTLVLKL